MIAELIDKVTKITSSFWTYWQSNKNDVLVFKESEFTRSLLHKWKFSVKHYNENVTFVRVEPKTEPKKWT